jgi:hypothetical protein
VHVAKKETNPKKEQDAIPGWFSDTAGGEYELGFDNTEKHSGSRSAYLKSLVAKPNPECFGNLCQWFAADEYRGRHLKMSAWVKTKLDRGSAQLWVRVDGEGHGSSKRDCFDNMGDRPIEGTTDWKNYSVVVDVPETSTEIYLGCMLIGTGKIWVDDVTVEAVNKNVPLTGNFTRKTQPANLNFEETHG